MTSPNILIITPHDTGQHFGCYGVKSLVGGSWNWALTDPRMHLSHVLRDPAHRGDAERNES